MKILGDSQIVLFDELFSHLGETATYTGRTLTAEQLAGVDVLITRSTLSVDEALLQGSDVKFVGTCTIGTDHFDLDYLDAHNMAWTNAAGCNANAVAQYVLSAMAHLAPNWLHSTVGIIACGNIGGRVYRRLKALGVNCCVYDPFLTPKDNPDLVSLEQVLQSDIITSHAPLTMSGEHPTFHLLGEQELEQLRPNTVLISAGRGAVIDNQALLRKLSNNKNIRVALDVWEDEPNILSELIPLVDIATPHIAGHSIEGKTLGTVMVYESLCEFLLRPSPVDVSGITHSDKVPLIVKSTQTLSDNDGVISEDQQRFNQLLLSVYPIMADDQRLRAWQTENLTPHRTMGEYFDYLRKTYPIRNEYSHFIFPAYTEQAPIDAWVNALVDMPC
jgi:erythronate-4-phosphate dehydrogenase